MVKGKIISEASFGITYLAKNKQILLSIGYAISQFSQKTSSDTQNISNNPNPNTENTVTEIENIEPMKDISFFCDNSSTRNQSQVKIKTPRGDKSLFILKTDDFDGSNWTKEKRCNHIANKLQTYQNKGTLENVKAGEVNLSGTIYPVICVPDEKEGSCNNEQTLVTFLPGKDASQILTALTDNPDSINVSKGYFSYDKQGYLVLNLPLFINSGN